PLSLHDALPICVKARLSVFKQDPGRSLTLAGLTPPRPSSRRLASTPSPQAAASLRSAATLGSRRLRSAPLVGPRWRQTPLGGVAGVTRVLWYLPRLVGPDDAMHAAVV